VSQAAARSARGDLALDDREVGGESPVPSTAAQPSRDVGQGARTHPARSTVSFSNRYRKQHRLAYLNTLLEAEIESCPTSLTLGRSSILAAVHPKLRRHLSS
jgi:hypothetical protein